MRHNKNIQKFEGVWKRKRLVVAQLDKVPNLAMSFRTRGNPDSVPRDILPEPFVADNYICSQDVLPYMPESLKTICLFLRESIEYYEKNEETYEEWFRIELSYIIQDFAVVSKKPALEDIGRLMSDIGPSWTQEAYQ